jgi:hypothetical protein
MHPTSRCRTPMVTVSSDDGEPVTGSKGEAPNAGA